MTTPSAIKAFRRSGASRKDERQENRWQRFGLLLYLHRHSYRRSQRLCLKVAIPSQNVIIGRRGKRAALAQVVSCGSADCPWCGVRWSERKAATLGLAITVHCANGGMVVMATYTLRHGVADDLDDLWRALSKAFTYATNGHKATRAMLRDVCLGFVVRKETTHGAAGWHPHLHVAYFVRAGHPMTEVRALIDQQREDVESYLHAHSPNNVSAYSRRYGLRISDPVTGADLEAVGEAVAKYMAKDAARELTSTATKAGRRAGNLTSTQLLLDAAHGDEHARDLYWRYEKAMKGKRRMRWSPGLAEALLPEELLGDAQEDEQLVPIAELGRDLWDLLRYLRWEHPEAGPTSLMDAVDESGDDEEAFAAIAALCQEWGLPDPEKPAAPVLESR